MTTQELHRLVLNNEIEAIAEMVETEEGFRIAYYDDPDRPSVASQVDIFATLNNIAVAIRARKRRTESE